VREEHGDALGAPGVEENTYDVQLRGGRVIDARRDEARRLATSAGGASGLATGPKTRLRALCRDSPQVAVEPGRRCAVKDRPRREAMKSRRDPRDMAGNVTRFK